MSVPSNLVPTRILQLPEDPSPSNLGWMMYVNNGVTYKVQVNAVLNVTGVPQTRQINAGAGLTGGGDLSQNRTISVAPGGIGASQLNNTGVAPGTYGSSVEIPVVIIDANGRVTSATTTSISVSGFVPLSTQVIAGVGLTGGGALNGNVTLNAALTSVTPLSLGIASAGVATTIARADHVHPALNLSDNSQTEGVLDLTRGGTGNSIVTPPNGGIVYSDGSQFEVSSSGAAGEVLISNGFAAPSWTPLGTIAYQDFDDVNITGGAIAGVTVSGTVVDVVNQGLLRLYELTANGTNFVALRAPAALSGDTTYTLPPGDGLSGQFLSTDGTGSLSWSTPVGAGDVVGPASSTDNAIARFNGVDGKTLQNSGVIVDDNNNVTLLAEGSIRLADTDSSNYVGFKAPGTVAADLVWTLPAADGTVGQVLSTDGTGALSFVANGVGTVTSVGLALPTEFTITNSPVTSSGTLTGAWATQAANYVLAAPDTTGGTPTFRAIVANDIPTLNQNTTGSAATATNVIGGAANRILYQTAGSTTNFIDAPTVANTYLEWSGSVFQWAANPLGTVTSVSGTGTVSGISLSGTVTSSGDLTLGGTLDLSSPPAIGGVAPAAGTFTTVKAGTFDTDVAAAGVTLAGTTLSSDGTDTNIDILLTPKGTGGVGINGAPTGVVAGAPFTSKFCVKNEDSTAEGGFVHANNTTASSGSVIFSCRSRGTLAAPAVVQNNDNLTSLYIAGFDGTDLALAATIDFFVDGTPGNNDMPGRMVFSTTPNNTQIPVEAMRIDSTQTVRILNSDVTGTFKLDNTEGAAGQVILGAGVGVTPTWANQSSLAVGSATDATNVNTTADATNADRFVAFLGATTGNNGVLVDSDLKYNPSTNALTAGSFSGDISNGTGTLNGGTY